MSAEQSLRDGNLDQALKDLQDQIRKDPASPQHRIFLFQLLSVLGQWDRALNQLSVLGEMDPTSLAMVQMYRETLKSEVFRSDVFGGQRSPLIFGEPEEWLALLVQALPLTTEAQSAEAQSLRERAFEAAPATSGTIDGKEFAWISDADPRLGPTLEAVLNGNYYWIPFHRIRRIVIEEPTDLRDMVWAAAHFEWANGGEAVGVIPTRYVGSENHENPLVRLSRQTEWQDLGDELFVGFGQRMIATDIDEFSLLDIREISLNVELVESADPADEAPAEATPEGDA